MTLLDHVPEHLRFRLVRLFIEQVCSTGDDPVLIVAHIGTDLQRRRAPMLMYIDSNDDKDLSLDLARRCIAWMQLPYSQREQLIDDLR